MMTIRKLFSAGFDINCRIEIYDCRNGRCWYEQGVSVYSGFGAPYKNDISDEIYDLCISYVTTNDGAIVIEVT